MCACRTVCPLGLPLLLLLLLCCCCSAATHAPRLPLCPHASLLQILCGRLRVMAQPHVREPPARQPVGLGQPAAAGAAAAAGDAAAAAPEMPADDDGAGGGGWVPDVMRCRWRHDPQQRRLLPRLRANTRAMALAMLVLAVAATNSLVVPLALERSPAYSERCGSVGGSLLACGSPVLRHTRALLGLTSSASSHLPTNADCMLAAALFSAFAGTAVLKRLVCPPVPAHLPSLPSSSPSTAGLTGCCVSRKSSASWSQQAAKRTQHCGTRDSQRRLLPPRSSRQPPTAGQRRRSFPGRPPFCLEKSIIRPRKARSMLHNPLLATKGQGAAASAASLAALLSWQPLWRAAATAAGWTPNWR